jgi:hypothetical protein
MSLTIFVNTKKQATKFVNALGAFNKDGLSTRLFSLPACINISYAEA